MPSNESGCIQQEPLMTPVANAVRKSRGAIQLEAEGPMSCSPVLSMRRVWSMADGGNDNNKGGEVSRLPCGAAPGRFSYGRGFRGHRGYGPCSAPRGRRGGHEGQRLTTGKRESPSHRQTVPPCRTRAHNHSSHAATEEGVGGGAGRPPARASRESDPSSRLPSIG